MSDVFVSHSSKDKETADKVVEFLEGKGLSCWIAPRDIIAGSDWAASISTAITASKIFLLIYSANSAASEQCARELGIAETKKNVFVVPYKTDDTPLSGSFEYFLTSAHWVAANYEKSDYKLEELYNYLANITGKAVQHITNNTFIDELHIHSDDPQAAQIIKQTRFSQDIPLQKPSGFMAVIKKNKIAFVILAFALVVAIAVLVALLASGSVMRASAPVIETTAVQTTDTQPAPEAEGEVALSFNGTQFTGSFTGYIDENGLPDGYGEFNGVNRAGDKALYNGVVSAGEVTGDGKLTITYENGGKNVFQGSFTGGKLNGTGTQRKDYADGSYDSYDGAFSNGSREGWGKLTIMTAEPARMETYEGEFLKNIYDGIGTLTITYSEGDISSETYVGSFKEGKHDGSGQYTVKYTSSELRIYEGEFTAGNYNGTGKLTITYSDSTIEILDGEFENGVFAAGIDTIYDYDGTIRTYEGEWADGRQNGYGKWTIKLDGMSYETYEGDNVDGKITGYEKIYVFYEHPEELFDVVTEEYEGYVDDWFYNGKGKLKKVYTSGVITEYEGDFSYGICEGRAVITYTDTNAEGAGDPNVLYKSVYDGEVLSGMANGQGKMVYYYSDGSTKEEEGKWEDDVFVG